MAQFKIAARTLVHLGSELITSDPIAVYELIKNSIDARSPNVSVHFHILFPQALLNEVSKSWKNLELDSNWREEVKKGLNSLIENKIPEGQLSLNQNSLLETIKRSKSPVEASENLQKVNFIDVTDTGEGMSAEQLDSVFLTIGTDSRLDKDIEGQPFLGNKGIGRISMMHLGDCSHVVSKKEGGITHHITFDWREFKDPTRYLSDIKLQVLQGSEFKHKSGTSIRISHLSKEWTKETVKTSLIDNFLRRLRNPFETEPFKFPIHIYFNGETEKNRLPIPALDERLWNLAQRTLCLDFAPDSKTTLTMSISDARQNDAIHPYEASLETLAHKFECSPEDIKKVGTFKFQLQWFNRNVLKSQIKDMGLSGEGRELRDELDLWSGGIAIYRDGFRVGMSGSFEEKDFFAIDSKALRGQGFTLNRIQIIASLEITKNGNKYLLDRSNREGLIENKQVQIISSLIKDLVLPQLRESINVDKKNEKPLTLKKVIKEDLDSATSKLNSVKRSITSIQSEVKPEQKRVLQEIKENLHSVSNHVKNFESLSNQLQEQREDILELAGTGTLMHVVMHELARTTSQTKELMIKIAKKSDPNINKLLKKLEKEIKTINVRIRQFDPHSISGRLRKESFDLVALIKTILEGYAAKTERHNIDISFTVDNEEPAQKHYVKVVQGFISIALENLLSNSTYWLSQNSVFSNYIFSEKKHIRIELDTKANVITIWDSGLGISPPDRERIFVPGFTTKKKSSDGKGFGLFLAKEVTQYNKGDLYLDSEPDKDGRLRTFVLELPKDKE